MQYYIDPYTKQPLTSGPDGALACKSGDNGGRYEQHLGCFDFVKASGELKLEREHYDKEYGTKRANPPSIASVRQQWHDELLPWRATLLKSLGELDGKRILLIGNGESNKEFYFHVMGAEVYFTDLSFQAVLHKKQEFDASDIHSVRSDGVLFQAVDAMHMPYPDDYFDVIYGSAFVHHLSDLTGFFGEVHRCLKHGGICRFLDQASAPLWEWSTRTILLPFKLYSYRKHPRSPADVEADQRGGFQKEKLKVFMDRFGFHDLLFIREWCLFRIASRHLGKLVNYNPRAMRMMKPLLLGIKRLDGLLAKLHFMRENQLMLVWGFTK